MAANTANAIKVLIENSGLGIAAYSDGADQFEQLPYITITEAIAVVPDGRSDGGDGESCTEEVQVDVWERWKDEDDVVVESPTLIHDVVRLLHGAQLDQAPRRVYGVTVINRRRLLEPAKSLVHHAITANVHRLI